YPVERATLANPEAEGDSEDDERQRHEREGGLVVEVDLELLDVVPAALQVADEGSQLRKVHLLRALPLADEIGRPLGEVESLLGEGLERFAPVLEFPLPAVAQHPDPPDIVRGA